MSYKIFLVVFLFLLISTTVLCQQKELAKSFNDSVENRYLYQGAYKYSFFSDEWQNELDSGLLIAPGNATLWQQKAMPYFKCRKYEVGLQYLDKAVALNPKEYLGYRAFINCIFVKNYSAAIIDYLNATKLNGDFTSMEHPYSFYIGISYLQLNKFDSAIHYLNTTVKTESPASGTPIVHFMDWFYLGIAFYELKHYSEAITYFDKVLLIYEHFSEAKFYKAICLHKLQIKKEEMLTLFEEAKIDFKKGYSFTEDNCVYEKYPYQLSGYVVKYHGPAM